MTQEMAMFWFAVSILILFWGMSQYQPRTRRPLHIPGVSIGALTGMMDIAYGQSNQEKRDNV